MAVRKSSIVLLVLGLLLIVGAGTIKFVVMPSMTKLPADLEAKQKYEGTIVALDPNAFAANDLANLIAPGMAVTADRKLAVDATDGDVAIVTSSTRINLPQGQSQMDVHTFAVDRRDYTPVSLDATQVDTIVPTEVKGTFEPHDGVAFSFPMDPPKDGMTVYDPVTRSAQSATFEGEETLEGRDVYIYDVDAAGPIENPVVLAQFADFPRQMPKATIVAFLDNGIVPADYVETVRRGVASMPDTVDIGFGSTNDIYMAVDQEFGTPLKVEQEQGMYVTVAIDGKDVPILPLSVASLHTAPDEVGSLAKDLSRNGTLLLISGTVIPLVLLVAGVVLCFVAWARWRKPAAVVA